MDRARTAFLAVTDVAIDLMRSDDVRERWDEPSALEQWQVKGLAGHLVRGTVSVEQYLDADPAPEDDPIDPAAYYAAAVDTFDLDSDLHRAIRQRGDDMAADGYEALVANQREVADRLRLRFEQEPGARKIRVHMGMVLLLDDYLVTRIVELAVHIDDLAVSLDLATPELPPDALELAIGALVATGRHRHGDLAVLRALSRRERDGADALRVL